jgi:hypothetical protein
MAELKQWMTIYGQYLNALRMYYLAKGGDAISSVQEIQDALNLTGSSSMDMIILWRPEFANETLDQITQTLKDSSVY